MPRLQLVDLDLEDLSWFPAPLPVTYLIGVPHA